MGLLDKLIYQKLIKQKWNTLKEKEMAFIKYIYMINSCRNFNIKWTYNEVIAKYIQMSVPSQVKVIIIYLRVNLL